MFTSLDEKPPKGFMWFGRRLTQNQATARPENLWPEVWSIMGKAAQKKEKQEWANEKPKLDNARRLRGISFIDPEGGEYPETIEPFGLKATVRVILVVLHLKARDRCSQLGAWDCVAGRKCGFKANFAWRETCRSCGRNKSSVGASQAATSGAKTGGVVWALCQSAMPRCGRRPRALTTSQQAEIEGKRRVAVEQPTAHSVRKQLEHEVAALSKLGRGSTR